MSTGERVWFFDFASQCFAQLHDDHVAASVQKKSLRHGQSTERADPYNFSGFGAPCHGLESHHGQSNSRSQAHCCGSQSKRRTSWQTFQSNAGYQHWPGTGGWAAQCRRHTRFPGNECDSGVSWEEISLSSASDSTTLPSIGEMPDRHLISTSSVAVSDFSDANEISQE